MTHSLSLAERIKFADRLPKTGSLDVIKQVKKIRKKLVGFTEQQMKDYIIVKVGDTFVTSNPDKKVMVTIDDELIPTYAQIVRERSAIGNIDEEESDFFEEILNEEQRLLEENSDSQTENQN